MLIAMDPGVTGAIAVMSTAGHLIEVIDMPLIEVRGKKRIDALAVAEILSERKPSMCVIEGVHPFRDSAQTAMFYFGYGAGVLEGVAAGLGIPCAIIPAATWKRKSGVPADKGAARQMAARYWPGASSLFARKKDDGRADAALLGRWHALTNGVVL